MKNSYFKITFFVFTLLILNSSFLIRNCMSQWVPVNNGIENQLINSLAVSGNTIFAGTFNNAPGNGVYKSTDNGTTWTQTSLNFGNVVSLAINGNNIFAGMGYPMYSGVYLSTNNGATWTQTPLNNQGVYALAVSGNKIFAGGNQGSGVYSSTDNGISWSQPSINHSVGSFLVNGNNIFAGTGNFGLYLSTNEGTTWNQISSELGIGPLAAIGNNIFTGKGYPTYSGVWLSTNNGMTWMQTSLNNQGVSSLAVFGNNIIAAANTVNISTDNGTSWIQWNDGLISHVNVYCILNNYIYAGTSFGVYRRPLSELTGIQIISSEIPNKFSLSQNYPNPFNPETNVKFQITNYGLVTLKIYNVLGIEAAVLVNENLQTGSYKVNWNASNYPSGIYYYKLSSGEFSQTNKMILLK